MHNRITFPYLHQCILLPCSIKILLEMWSEDLHWAWKLREQKRKQDEIKNSTNPSVLESKELFELYATDLGQEIEMEQTPLNLITKEK